MNDAPQAAAVAVVTPAPPTRSLTVALIASIGAIVGSGLTIGGTVFATGLWSGNLGTRVTAIEQRLDRGDVIVRDTEMAKRLDVAEANQRQYIPVLVGMRSDLTFLADRARREDDRRDRQLGSRP